MYTLCIIFTKHQCIWQELSRTDDWVIDKMLEHEDGFVLNGNDDEDDVLTPSEKKDHNKKINKNPKEQNDDDVDQEVMMELAKETPNGDINDNDNNNGDNIEISGDDESFGIETMQWF